MRPKQHLLLPLIILVTAASATAQSNPCEDPVYLRLVEMEIDDMSEREFEVFNEKSRACTEWLSRNGQPAPSETPPAPADTAAKIYRTDGFLLRAHLNFSSVWIDENTFFDDYNSGGGLGIGVGYGFNKLVALMFNLDFPAMQTEFDDNYVLVYGDLGVRFTFGPETSSTRPYAEVYLTGFGSEIDFESGRRDVSVEIYGGALTVGGGLLVFVSRKLALDFGLLLSGGEVSEFKVGPVSLDTDIGAASTRLNVGISWWP